MRGFAHAAGLALAVVVATLTLAVVVHAGQTITTPNAFFSSYSLAPGANSSPIEPVTNKSNFLMCAQTASGFRGVGQVALLRVPSTLLVWTGIESPAGAGITSGSSGTAGTHIVWCDFSHTVDIRVDTPDKFLVHNGNATLTATGNVTLIW